MFCQRELSPMKNNAEFEKKINHCPLCDSKNISDKYIIDTYSPAFNISLCNDCRFMFINPVFTDTFIKELYSEDYYNGNNQYAYHDERQRLKYEEKVWKKRIKKIHAYIDCGNFLDVGASFGGLLQCASTFFNPYGIEISPYAAAHANKLLNNQVHNGTLYDHPYQDNFFSVITMIEVIEHLKKPQQILKECYSLLKPGGLLVVQTANFDGQQARQLKQEYNYFMPGHVSYFSKANVISALQKVGFTRCKVFYPVEFGLLPKLLKSRGSFNSIKDYRRWISICMYHLKSKIHFKDYAATSSMVVYAFK